jgi:hypothetical protein
MNAFWAWTLKIVALAVMCLVVFAIIRATGKSRTSAVRDADAQHGIGASPRPEDQPGYVSPYRS